MKKIKTDRINTGISPNYVKNWDIEKAIREIVQNYLDSKQEFECGGSIQYKDGMAIIKDNGPGLDLKHLALGVSEKGAEAKGKYGEGLKLALLVFAREDRHIEIWSKGKRIWPVLVVDKTMGTEVLDFVVTDLEPRMAKRLQGTSIKFNCSKEELESGKKYFVEFERKSPEFRWIEKDKISEPGGWIYINGTKVGHFSNLRFSYHIKDSDHDVEFGNRDREVVNFNLVKPVIKRMVSSTTSEAVMQAFLQEILKEETYDEMEFGVNPYFVESCRKRVWLKIANRIFDERAVVKSENSRVNQFVSELGYRLLEIKTWNWENLLKEVGFKTADDVAKKAGSAKVANYKLKELTEEERKIYKEAVKRCKKHYHHPGKIKIVDEIERLYGNIDENTTTYGIYHRKEDMIYLSRAILTDEKQATKILIHEVVHKITDYEDNTREFESALLDVAINMMF